MLKYSMNVASVDVGSLLSDVIRAYMGRFRIEDEELYARLHSKFSSALTIDNIRLYPDASVLGELEELSNKVINAYKTLYGISVQNPPGSFVFEGILRAARTDKKRIHSYAKLFNLTTRVLLTGLVGAAYTNSGDWLYELAEKL